jgi:hypothetical protein
MFISLYVNIVSAHCDASAFKEEDKSASYL